MRRRRQKNTLLPKMLGLAVLINAIVLPILAQFGVFKSIGGHERLTPIELVKAPPPEKRPAPPKKTPKKQAAKAKPAGHKAAPRTVTARRAPSGLPPVKVVAAAGPPGGNGNGDSGIAPSDSGPTPAAPPGPNAGGGEPAPPPTPLTPPAPPAAQTPPPRPAPTPPPPPHVPAIVAAVPLSRPQPTIPDELRDGDLNTAFEGLFTVHADGTASVKTVFSTGNAALDALALEAAQRWTFRPATRDGQPVESYLRLKIEFQVNS